MEYVRHFGAEVAAFEAAARKAAGSGAAPEVPARPGWVMTDLVTHLGVVHALVARIVGERMQEPPGAVDPPEPAEPDALLDWFREGAEALEERLFLADPAEPVWSWSADHTVGFWQRTQAIEAAVHRWDAEKAVGTAEPIDSVLATDAVRQHFEVMAPMRRGAVTAPPGHGEHFLFRRTDGPQSWRVRFDGDRVLRGPADGRPDIEIAGRVSDLALYLSKRPVNGQLDIQGNTRMLGRYFDLVPPLDAGQALRETLATGQSPRSVSDDGFGSQP